MRTQNLVKDEQLDRTAPRGDVQYYRCRSRRLVYVKMAKVGCTSIIRALMEAEGCTDPAHLGNPHHNGWRYLDVSTETPMADDTFVFSFVRHPIPRVMSFYRNKLVEPEDAYIAPMLNELGLTHGLSFNEMVERLITIDPERLEQHIRPQHLSLIQDGAMIPNMVSKLEYVPARWPVLQKAFDLPALARDNPSAKSPIEMTASAYDDLLSYFDGDFRAFRYNRFPIEHASTLFGFSVTE